MLAVDAHAHVFERGLPLAPVRRHSPQYDALAETYLDLLRTYGFDMGLLVQPSFFGADNSYILAALRKYPQKFRGVAGVTPDISEKDFHILHEAGFAGMRLNLVGLPLVDLGGPEWTPLLRMVRKHDWHVELHRESRDLPLLIRPLLEAGVKVVVDHFGRIDPVLLQSDPVFPWLLGLGPSRRVWMKISATYRLGNLVTGERFARQTMPRLLEAFGPDRLLWGSDWPHTQHEDHVSFDLTVGNLAAWIPDPAVRNIILRKAPADLFAPQGALSL